MAKNLFNVVMLAELTGINHQRLDNNFKGISKSLTSDEKQLVHATLIDEANKLAQRLNGIENEGKPESGN